MSDDLLRLDVCARLLRLSRLNLRRRRVRSLWVHASGDDCELLLLNGVENFLLLLYLATILQILGHFRLLNGHNSGRSVHVISGHILAVSLPCDEGLRRNEFLLLGNSTTIRLLCLGLIIGVLLQNVLRSDSQLLEEKLIAGLAHFVVSRKELKSF